MPAGASGCPCEIPAHVPLHQRTVLQTWRMVEPVAPGVRLQTTDGTLARILFRNMQNFQKKWACFLSRKMDTTSAEPRAFSTHF